MADDVVANRLALWFDEPASTDLLSFNAVAETIADALFDEKLNPIALGVSGSWGSGKTTVLNLIDAQVTLRSAKEANSVLVVRADPWRYDPSVGPKESLISEVLEALLAIPVARKWNRVRVSALGFASSSLRGTVFCR